MLTPGEQYDENIPIYQVFTPIVRDFHATDISFIVKTWLNAYAQERKVMYTPARYYVKQQELIHRLCREDKTRIAIVCDEDNPEYIVAFAVTQRAPQEYYRPLVLHFAYTKEAYRKQGFFKMALASLGWRPRRKILCTHWTRYIHDCKRSLILERDDWLLMGIENANER